MWPSVTFSEKYFTYSYSFMLFTHYIFSISDNKDTSLFQFPVLDPLLMNLYAALNFN